MKGMSPKEKRAYICRYYWHYFLIGGIILGLVILLIYHLTLGNQKPVFQCVAVNQEIDLLFLKGQLQKMNTIFQHSFPGKCMKQE